ncbi:MAG: thrombospondin type 3 repeat-containing protein [Phycisphaerae bacterium]
MINRDCGVCVGGSNNGDPCNILLPPETECPNGYCDGFCEPQRGCGDPWCCTAVCDLWDYYCCIVEWDAQCAAKAFVLCNTPPANDHCWSPDPIKGARLVYIPSITEGDALHATEDLTDPGFCCHGGVHCPGGMCCHAGNEDCYASQYGLCVDGERDGKPCDREASGDVGPGSPGYGTVWYKFVAPDTSVELLTCNSSNLPRVNDSVISVYVPAEPDRGICDDLSICSVSTQDCFDGSPCILDERHACEHLLLIGCSDDVEYCSPNDANARLCVTDLEIGQTYYVLVGAKIDLIPDSPYYDRVTFNLEVYADCTPPEPPMPNDFCQNATPLAGDDLDVAFDLSGGDEYAPATFHCPGEPGCPVLLNDVWYDWVAPARGEATITTCDENLPPQDQPNTTLCVYDGCNCPLEIGTLIGECNFGTFDECGLSGTVTFDAVSGECYKIRLGGHMGDTPAGELSISLSGAFPDCNGNGVPDDEDIASGTSEDCDSDGTPDECETDSDGDGTIDECDGCPDDPNKIHPGVCGCGVAYCQIPFKGEVVKSSPEPGEPGRGVPRGASTIPPKE